MTLTRGALFAGARDESATARGFLTNGRGRAICHPTEGSALSANTAMIHSFTPSRHLTFHNQLPLHLLPQKWQLLHGEQLKLCFK
jgi:hypothetical protein